MNSSNVFSLILATGASFALWRVVIVSPSAQRIHWLLAGLISLFGALLGARVGYVLEHFHYFSLNPNQTLQFWQGGLSWIGALAGAIALLLLVARVWQWPFWVVLDQLSRMVLPLGIATWLACWQSGAAYGISLQEGTWWGIRALDESGQFGLHSPVQPLAALSQLVFIGVLELLLNKTDTPGLRGSLVFLVFSADMLLFSFLRADPAQVWLGLRIETWAAMVYTLIGIVITIEVLLRAKHLRFDRSSTKVLITRK